MELPHVLQQQAYYLQHAERDLQAAWAAVSASAGNLTLFRIDNLIWQVADVIFRQAAKPDRRG